MAAIPVANPLAQVQALQAELSSALQRVLTSGHYILGPEVTAFENEFAQWLGAAHAIGVASGTDAVALALRAVGVLPGQEVITVSHSAVATVAAIEQVGAVPVWVDIDPLTRCLDATMVERALSPKTAAIVPVHIFGQAADMKALIELAQRHYLQIVEDCAQAHGAKIGERNVGTFGHAAAFSFYPTKNLGAVGDGGAVVTHDAAVAARVRSLRQYGWEERYISSATGFNSRLDELQAALLRVKLAHLPADLARRQQIAATYTKALAGHAWISAPTVTPGTTHAWHLYVVECDDPQHLAAHMAKREIGSARHYPLAIHQQPAYRGRLRGEQQLHVTERLYRRMLTVPLFGELTDDQVARVAQALKEFAGTAKA